MCKTSLNIDLIGVPRLVLRSFAPVPCFLPTMSLKQQFCYLDLFLLQDSSPFILEKSWLQFLKAPMVCFKYPFFQFTSSAQEVEPRGGCGWCVVWGSSLNQGETGGAECACEVRLLRDWILLGCWENQEVEMIPWSSSREVLSMPSWGPGLYNIAPMA